MSWLYSIVFAGLALASNGETAGTASIFEDVRHTAIAAIQGDERERFEQSYPLSANGRVKVSNVNGSIVVEAWDRNEVKLEAVKIAESKEALADVRIKVDSRGESLSVEADYDSVRRERGERSWKTIGRLEVQFRLMVPRTAALDEIETVNGSVTVSNFTNLTKVSAVNGHVIATNIRGAASLSTVNGEVTADFDRLEPGSKIALSTVNGKVNLVLPSDASATLKADSVNGDIRNDFGLPVRKGKYVGRDMYGRLGAGDVQIRLESVNGSLNVQRKNDGRTVSPAIDMLPHKAKDREADWDNDTSWRSNSVKLNNDIAKAVKDAAKATEAGVGIAQAELVRLAPEIEKIRVESLEKFKNMNEAELNRLTKEGIRKQREGLSSLQMVTWSGRNPFIEKKSNSFTVKGTPKVVIEAKGSSVNVRGWDRNEVKYVLTEMDGRRRMMASVGETATASSVTLKVLNNELASRDIYFNGNTDAIRIEVFVPQRSNLKIVSNGEIRLDGIVGDVELSGVDEEIDVRNSEGKLRLSSVDGQVRIIGFTGELESKTGSGDVYLEGNFSRIEGTAGEGSIIFTVPENYNADVTSNVESLTIENLGAPKAVREGHWRFGSGGPKLNITVKNGDIKFRSTNSLVGSRE